MKPKQNVEWWEAIPAVVLIVGVGTVTGYNLLYTIPAGIVGVLISHGLRLRLKKRR